MRFSNKNECLFLPPPSHLSRNPHVALLPSPFPQSHHIRHEDSSPMQEEEESHLQTSFLTEAVFLTIHPVNVVNLPECLRPFFFSLTPFPPLFAPRLLPLTVIATTFR